MSRQLDLMKLHDGELSAEEIEALERELGDDDLALLEGLEQVGDVVRALAEDQGGAADGIADGVMAELERDGRVAPRLEVLPGGSAGDQGELPKPRAGGASALPFVAGAMALAAAVLLYIGFANRPNEPGPVARPTAAEPATPAVATALTPEPLAGAVAEEEAAPAASIEAVDFGNQPGSIFMVPAGDETTPVVWLVDEPTSARMEPL